MPVTTVTGLTQKVERVYIGLIPKQKRFHHEEIRSVLPYIDEGTASWP